MRRTALLAVVAGLIALGASAPPPLAAQSVVGKIKRTAKQKVEDQKRSIEQGVVDQAVEPLDSTLAKGARPVDSAVARTTAHADSAVSRVERVVRASLEGEPHEVRRIAEGLREGRFVLDQLSFLDGTEELDPASEGQLAALAEALTKTAGTFLLQVHVAMPGNEKASQQLAARRGTAVKDWLVAAGITESRLFVAGHSEAFERVEIVGMH
jgi:outer membrane protein OmpA-like peptidoglycan-associated protein